MQAPDEAYWTTDPELFASLPGGEPIIDWFGFMPSFHDARLAGLEIGVGAATIKLHAFRMTGVVNERGYFTLDRQALITLTVSDVTGVILTGDAEAIIAELGIRRVREGRAGFPKCGGPQAGDFEVSFESIYGLEGSIFGRGLVLSLSPAAEA